MKINESNLDRIIRVIAGVVLIALYFSGVLSGVAGVIGLIVGVIALLTGAIGFCPLYTLLRIRTNKG